MGCQSSCELPASSVPSIKGSSFTSVFPAPLSDTDADDANRGKQNPRCQMPCAEAIAQPSAGRRMSCVEAMSSMGRKDAEALLFHQAVDMGKETGAAANLARRGSVHSNVNPECVEAMLIQQADDVEMEARHGSARTIALVAHDNMKILLRKFVNQHAHMLKEFDLTGTAGSCQVMRSEGLHPKNTVSSGPLGGDQQIGAMIAQGEIHALLFFRDPLTAHAHHADVEALGRLADCYQCYFATNYRTASAILGCMCNDSAIRQRRGSRESIKAELVDQTQRVYFQRHLTSSF